MKLTGKLFAKVKIYFLLALLFIFSACIYTAWSIPHNLVLLENEEYSYKINSIIPLGVSFDKQETVALQFDKRQTKLKNQFQFANSVLMKTFNKGNANLKIKLFGIFPIKTVKVDVMPNNKVVACGNTIGVKLNLDGILVIGMGEIETINGKRIIPAGDTGIKPGDFILQANYRDVVSISDLIEIINHNKGNEMHLRYRRGDTYNDIQIKPVKSIDDNNYHIGLWVRDNTAGIGTLTFFEPETLNFGALGHGITDVDTGVLLPSRQGEIVESNILAVKKGEGGTPGELRGIFAEHKGNLGMVNVNSNFGIYGKLYPNSLKDLPKKVYPIGVRTEIKEGPAKIIANIEGEKITEYSIEIQKVSIKQVNGSKGMVIKITDKRLLDVTGGIVQGMSGSPIIQNGKIIGAVTHVLVNDPSRGYGIFIENMIKKMYENDNLKKNKAEAS